MRQSTLLGKLLSPAGFGLVLLFFALPFVAVSCGPDPDAQITATFTGLDMISAGAPSISGLSIDDEDVANLDALFADQYDTEPFAILATIVILGGMATAFVRNRVARHSAAVGLALLAIVLLEVAVVRAMRQLERLHLSDNPDNALPPGEASPRIGLYLAVAALLVVAAGHAVILGQMWSARRPGAAAAGTARPGAPPPGGLARADPPPGLSPVDPPPGWPRYEAPTTDPDPWSRPSIIPGWADDEDHAAQVPEVDAAEGDVVEADGDATTVQTDRPERPGS